MAGYVGSGFSRIVLVAVLISPYLLASQASQQKSENTQAPTFRTGTNLVRVDVVATEKSGRPVMDLGAEDFEVSEDGKRQRIEAFSLLRIEHGLTADVPINLTALNEEEAARDDVRVLAIFLDDYHVSTRGSSVVSEQLARFVEDELAPSDMIGVMHPQTALDDVRINRNHDEVVRALRNFSGRTNRAMTAAAQAYLAKSPREAPRIRREISLSALKALILRLGGLKEGRKTILLVTEGFAGSRNDVGLLYDDLRSVSDLASRYNVALYPVHPLVLAPRVEWGLTDATETLTALARGSGGRTVFDIARTTEEYRTRNQRYQSKSFLGPLLTQVLTDASANYLIGYRSPLTVPDDKLHKIAVTVKRRGVELRYRRAWWAVKPTSEGGPATPRYPEAPRIVDLKIMQEALAATITPRGRLVRTWVGMSPGENGRTRVTFVWEPIPRPGDRWVPARLRMTATAAQGGTLFEGELPSAASGNGKDRRAVFEASPGSVQLRWRVEDADGNLLDNETRAVRVTDFADTGAVFGTPEILAARTVAEFERLKSDPSAAPAAGREFGRVERFLLRIPLYGLDGESPPDVEAQLVSRAGRLITGLSVAFDRRGAAQAAQIELGLANLAPDDYAVRLVLRQNDNTLEDVVAFRVVN
jgi:VWFA-related protein